MANEDQRYGRNKNTLVNKSYIDSGEYKRKFDNATDNPEVNKSLYDSAKNALKHRSGTELEDMYWIDGNTGRIVAKETDSKTTKQVDYSSNTQKIVDGYEHNQLITIHTHPASMPPSVNDFNSCCSNNYKMGFVACHNGKVYGYTSKQMISPKLYDMYIADFIDNGADEFTAQLKAINKLSENHAIEFWEVE